MKQPSLSNRRAFGAVGIGSFAMAALPYGRVACGDEPNGTSELPVGFALNTSTIRGQKLAIDQQIELVARVGYDGIEPWMRDIDAYVDAGGDLKKLAKQLQDSGLKIASAIGFANWIANDPDERKKGLETARRDMERVAELGGSLIAAPPIGAHRKGDVSPPLAVIAERYRELCEVGASVGVRPQLELWGFSPTLSKLGELAYVAAEASHEMACVLPDFYHIYKGGNDFESLKMIEGSKIHCFHINDYPGDLTLDAIGDRDRVFPGDGVCPLPELIAMLVSHGFRGMFSLELFNRDYWKREADAVAREGLEKCRRVVGDAMT
ncbi:MAG: sugar phosphate isomerase/epimerase family protein, partial [Planctomycetota bacterium]